MKNFYKVKKSNNLGLYIHIPFCSFLCHYCDFRKTSLWNKKDFTLYCESLAEHFTLYLKSFPALKESQFSSLNFGGGTPSLLASEYKVFFDRVRSFLRSDCEISLEANPKDITQEKLFNLERSWL
jgi:Coproporphyrinogen III oxidase and related Fe-S oxidoreductases